ncbi:MAG: CBS domain-containing protein [Thermodesulfobacteriota bacterium]|nr:CBS domain-containing protein [Thermodesulfobacteriota bacterium]
MADSIVRVRDVMQNEVPTIEGMASARDAAEMMRSIGATELLVARRSEDDAWGIITVMDLVKHVVIPDREAENVFVYEIMTKPVVTVPADMDVRYAIRLMERIGVRRAPVEHLGELIGLITLYNLILEKGVL